VTDAPPSRRPVGFAVFLLITGLIGFLAAFQLIVERIHNLQNPEDPLSCAVSPFIDCGANFDAWQGSLLGFPNPLLGVAGFVAPIAVAVGLLAGARFDRWFWRLFTGGILGAYLFITWLFTQTAFVIGVLCPFCMVVWLATIPMWWHLLAWTLKHGLLFGDRTRAFGAVALRWAWAVTLVNYAVMAVILIAMNPLLLTTL
jgi:uncharacterized membrane protein